MLIKIRFKIYSALVMILIASHGLPCFAQPALEVSGIINDEKPMAIINGNLVQTEDRIEGYTVEEIGADFVRFSTEDQGVIIKRLADSAENKEADHDSAGYQAYQEERMPRGNDRLQESFNKNIANAQSYSAEAERLMQSRIKYIKLYDEAIKLYEKAERELQYTLNKNFDDEYRKKAGSLISQITNERITLIRNKKDLEKDIADAKRKRQLILGMTSSDVISSVGRPYEKNSSPGREQWIYRVSEYRDMYIYIDDGILTSWQN